MLLLRTQLDISGGRASRVELSGQREIIRLRELNSVSAIGAVLCSRLAPPRQNQRM